jgi:hypothetical protein
MDFRGANETASHGEHVAVPPALSRSRMGINWTRLQLYDCHYYTTFTGGLKRRFAAPYKIVND